MFNACLHISYVSNIMSNFFIAALQIGLPHMPLTAENKNMGKCSIVFVQYSFLDMFSFPV